MPEFHNSPKRWLLFAESDLELAKIAARPKVLLETLCFHAQQSAEKSIKAVLVNRKIDFPYTHNIGYLLKLAKESGLDLPDYVNQSVILSTYSTVSRYPSEMEPVTLAQYHEAINLAEAVLHWACNEINPLSLK